jgi:hypothetical protein
MHIDKLGGGGTGGAQNYFAVCGKKVAEKH